jgi:RNAse (barnase) inhibitor barstar
MPPKPQLTIDGERFGDLQGFYDEVSQQLIPGADWGRNLDAFNDILRGGFGIPDGGFVLCWRNSDRSRRALGYEETVRWLEDRVVHAHPSNREYFTRRLADARCHRGQTLFDALIEIIRIHGAGGAESEDGVDLVLE